MFALTVQFVKVSVDEEPLAKFGGKKNTLTVFLIWRVPLNCNLDCKLLLPESKSQQLATAICSFESLGDPTTTLRIFELAQEAQQGAIAHHDPLNSQLLRSK